MRTTDRGLILTLDAMADSQRQPARKGPHQAWDIQEDSAYEPRLMAGFALWWLDRFGSSQGMVHEHAKPHLFPPDATKPSSRFVGRVRTLNVHQHYVRLADVPHVEVPWEIEMDAGDLLNT